MSDAPDPRPTRPAAPGHILKSLRLARGWTLADLSQRAGLAVSAISKAENGKVALTYDKLLRFADALGVDVSELFGPPAALEPPASQAGSGRRCITLAQEGVVIETENYRCRYPVTELLHRRFIPIVADLLARSIEEFGELVSHAGEEYAYVLAGEVELHTALYRPLRLRVGDSVYFDSTMGHAYIAAAPGLCRVLSICSAEGAADHAAAAEGAHLAPV